MTSDRGATQVGTNGNTGLTNTETVSTLAHLVIMKLQMTGVVVRVKMFLEQGPRE